MFVDALTLEEDENPSSGAVPSEEGRQRYVYIYIYIFVYVFVYICMYICIIYIYIRTHVFTFI
jgi:hypothetical protein